MLKKIALALMVLSLGQVMAQDKSPIIRDGQFWTSISTKTDISKRWQLSSELAFRANNNWQSANSLFMEFGAKWSKKDWSASANFRTVESYNRKENRWFTDISYDIKSSKRLDISTRVRVQHAFYSDDRVAQTYIRNKFKASYNIKKSPLNPVADVELYCNAGAYQPVFEVIRWSLGLEFELIKKLDLTIMYRNEREFNIVAPKQSNILIVAFSHDFGKLYKKNKKGKKD
ncbi:MAG: hypothetical protein ACJAUV_000361 [Flavobacteriales bacterium]|jgi:hypothetical protein